MIIFLKSGILWQYCKDKRALDANGEIREFNSASATTNLFNIKTKIAGQTDNRGTKNVKIMVWRTLEIHLVNCEINPIQD